MVLKNLNESTSILIRTTRFCYRRDLSAALRNPYFWYLLAFFCNDINRFDLYIFINFIYDTTYFKILKVLTDLNGCLYKVAIVFALKNNCSLVSGPRRCMSFHAINFYAYGNFVTISVTLWVINDSFYFTAFLNSY